jgi:hypothetical protein
VYIYIHDRSRSLMRRKYSNPRSERDDAACCQCNVEIKPAAAICSHELEQAVKGGSASILWTSSNEFLGYLVSLQFVAVLSGR